MFVKMILVDYLRKIDKVWVLDFLNVVFGEFKGFKS